MPSTKTSSPPLFSRRGILTTIASAPALRSPGLQEGVRGGGDEVAGACEVWLAKNAESERLQVRWSRLEDHLVRDHRWHRLTERERCNLPAAQELFDIDERLDILRAERDALLTRLPTLQASNRTGLAAKLAVAAMVVSPDDHEDAHTLIASILHDLQSISVERT